MEQHIGFRIGQHLTKRCLVFGCGNPLFGDDGFGAQVIDHLLKYCVVPEDAAVLDAGTAVRDFLFDVLLSPRKPEQIVIIDAMAVEGGRPGRIFAIDIDQIHPAKISDYSLHQFPTTNMLKEIREDTDIQVQILVVHPEDLPPEVRPGLSPAVQAAVPLMCRRVLEVIGPDRCKITGRSGPGARNFFRDRMQPWG